MSDKLGSISELLQSAIELNKKITKSILPIIQQQSAMMNTQAEKRRLML